VNYPFKQLIEITRLDNLHVAVFTSLILFPSIEVKMHYYTVGTMSM